MPRPTLSHIALTLWLITSSVWLCPCRMIGGNSLTGNVITQNGEPLPFANVVLLTAPDSTFIVGAVTDDHGVFRMDTLAPSGLIQVSSVGYTTTIVPLRAADTLTIRLQEDTQRLTEVVVTSQELSTFGNKDQLFLSETQKNMGSNALDAISALPQFRQEVGGTALSTVDNKSILVLINGIRRDPRDLMQLQADDIRSITYYTNPPARYAHENIGAVIDVATKRRTERLFTAYLSAKNGVTTGYGTNLLSLGYRDSLHTLSAAYFIDYRKLNHNLMHNAYIYDDQRNDYQGIGGTYSGQYHIGQLNYQLNYRKSLFNAKLEYRQSPGKQQYEQVLRGKTDSILIHSRQLTSNYSSVSADLYYDYRFTDQHTLSLNVLNTYYRSHSDNSLSSASIYSIKNQTFNTSYSLIAEALYTGKLWGGNISAGMYYQYKNLHQTYNAEYHADINAQREYLYAEYSNGVEQLKGCHSFSYDIGLGVENNHYLTATAERFHYFVFRPSLALTTNFDHGLSLRYTAAIHSDIPNIGDLTDSKVAVDEHFFMQGNSALRPYYNCNTDLQFQYMSRDNKWYVSATLLYRYYPHRNMPVLTFDGADAVQRLTRIDNTHEAGASLAMKLQPLPWLNIQPYYNYLYSNYITPNSHIRHSMHNAGIGVHFTPKNWQISWNGNLPVTTVNGDLYCKSGFQMTAAVQYKYQNISVALNYIYNPHPSVIYADIQCDSQTPVSNIPNYSQVSVSNIPNYSQAPVSNTQSHSIAPVLGIQSGTQEGVHSAHRFAYSEETVWNNFRNLIAWTFTYYFSRGKTPSGTSKHTTKHLTNSDPDSGLTPYNTAK